MEKLKLKWLSQEGANSTTNAKRSWPVMPNETQLGPFEITKESRVRELFVAESAMPSHSTFQNLGIPLLGPKL